VVLIYYTTTLNENASWNVTFDSNGNAIIKNAKDSTRILQFNANSGQERFACYTGTQKSVQIFVYA
jgi:HKD family nuclease